MLITIKEAAIRLGYHPSHVRRLVAAGILPATEISARIRLIDPDDLAKITRRKPGRKGKVKNG